MRTKKQTLTFDIPEYITIDQYSKISQYKEDNKLEQIVNDAMTRQLRGDRQQQTALYESIEHYTQMTGKRFRMTKDQKGRNLSRDQAFQEFLRGQ